MFEADFARKSVVSAIVMGLFLCTQTWAQETPDTLGLADLGKQLFFDENLSANRTQACASCHNPDFAFSDPRGMASPGDDSVSVGDRNAPTAMYAAMTPVFQRDEDGTWKGGQFHDGRAATLADQAAGPPLNPLEMGMKSKAEIAGRLKENPEYVKAFPALFGTGILDDSEAAYEAMTQAIAAFEETAMFAPFTSKYDRFLRGEAELSDEEELGRLLFFSQQFTNCNQCHQLRTSLVATDEIFTDHKYHNIGVPENLALRNLNGVAPGTKDIGLAANPLVDGDPAMRGKFRTPTLRNVAVTGPYMHNGVFADLRTVILFYNQYNTVVDARKINPETGEMFRPPEITENLSVKELTHGPALKDQRVDALVAFLKTLTDARYEPLLEED